MEDKDQAWIIAQEIEDAARLSAVAIVRGFKMPAMERAQPHKLVGYDRAAALFVDSCIRIVEGSMPGEKLVATATRMFENNDIMSQQGRDKMATGLANMTATFTSRNLDDVICNSSAHDCLATLPDDQRTTMSADMMGAAAAMMRTYLMVSSVKINKFCREKSPDGPKNFRPEDIVDYANKLLNLG